MKELTLLQSLITLGWLSVCLMILLLLFPLLISTTYPTKVVSEVRETTYNSKPEGLSDSDAEAFVLGKKLFKLNCASCHNKNMLDDMAGPALNGVKERWSAYPEKDLHDWIRNSSSLIERGHPRAIELWEKWDRVTMNSFPNLTDREIEAILIFINRGR